MRKTLIGLAALVVAGSLAHADPSANRCFFVNQSWTWKSPDDRTMYVRVFPRQFYRLDMAGKCPQLLWPTARLVTVARSDNICGALDWDLKVSSGPGSPAVPCIVTKMTPLTAEQAAQIPPKFKPQ